MKNTLANLSVSLTEVKQNLTTLTDAASAEPIAMVHYNQPAGLTLSRFKFMKKC